MNATIRRARPEDAALVRTLVGELADHQDEGRYVTSTVDRWQELLAEDAVIVLLAQYDSEPAGYVSAVRRLHLWSGTDVLGLDDLYVREAFRSKGIGRLLMLELARVALPERLTISWGMRPSNHGGQRFYRRLGAILGDKVVARWPAEAYSRQLTDESAATGKAALADEAALADKGGVG
ncbi:GCN5-related N-acetyltransferase [Kribbella flavida DSM 17836]|uniref:GCN5-related N-acetyltransferase n=1 Tax=Kribbella flavida (strain DSM 17836 / JCM 10339 / NBRC 14399) TaxID=479435 RepID=D2PLL1_KRIFD|nr:GNAT family N-acetyltransferase [Kribbella flavida]ADB30640.1 GCN5-related N-acetyltransferase [Kribbella flavida DSM 17836]